MNGCRMIARLKKQSQFAKGKNDAKLVMTIVYGIFSRWRHRKNKANQSQFSCEAEPAQAIPKACGFEAATQRQTAKKKGYLKKQSQFSKG